MYGRTVLKAGLIFPLFIIVLASAADIYFYNPDGPHGRPLMFPPVLIGYILFFPWSWRLLNTYNSYQQARTHLLVAPLAFGLIMSLSSAVYSFTAGELVIDNFLHSFAWRTALMAVIGFAYIFIISAALGLFYIIGVSREYVPNYAIKGTSV